VPGEDRERVYHRLYSPRKYHDEQILVVGGGNSAIEAVLTLAEQNKVVLSYRAGEFSRVFKDNQRKLDEAIAAKRIEVLFHSSVREFRAGETTITIERGDHVEKRTVQSDHAFVLVGAELPVKFLKSLGIKLENEWDGSPLRAFSLLVALLLGLCWFAAKPGLGGQPRFAGFGLSWLAQTFLSNTWIGNHLHFGDGTGLWIGFVPWQAGIAVALLALGGLIYTGVKGDRWSWLGISFFLWYSVYGIKFGKGDEF